VTNFKEKNKARNEKRIRKAAGKMKAMAKKMEEGALQEAKEQMEET
jgi:DNA-binding FrmR family transcriptional regulator